METDKLVPGRASSTGNVEGPLGHSTHEAVSKKKEDTTLNLWYEDQYCFDTPSLIVLQNTTRCVSEIQ